MRRLSIAIPSLNPRGHGIIIPEGALYMTVEKCTLILIQPEVMPPERGVFARRVTYNQNLTYPFNCFIVGSTFPTSKITYNFFQKSVALH